MKKKKSMFVIDQATPDVASNALKSVSLDGDEMRVANHIVLFGDKDHKDLDGEWFTPTTDLESQYTMTNMVIEDFEHGYGRENGVGPTADDIFGRVDWKTAKVDEYGVWVERVLDRRNKYVEYIQPLLEAGLLGTSSESIGDDVVVSKTGEIIKWPLKRDTLTVMPAEPRMLTDNVMRAIKSLAIAFPAQEAEPEAESTTAVEATQPEKQEQPPAVWVNLDLPPASKGAKRPQEKLKMSKKQDKVLADYAELNGVEIEDLTEAQKTYAFSAAGTMDMQEMMQDEAMQSLAKSAAAEAVKAAMEAAPAINGDAGKSVTVTLDEADRPFKSIAENVLAARELKVHGEYAAEKLYPRMKFLKATGASEGVPSDGGLLLEPTFTSEIIKPLHEDGPFSSMARKLPVGANSNSGWINGVDETSRVDGSRWGGVRGYWLAEAATKTASKPTFKRINWELKKVAVVVVATDELLADSAQFSEIVRIAAGEELNFMINAEIFDGIGAAGPLGMLQSGSLISAVRTDANEVDGDDVSRMYNRMHIRGRNSAAWFISNEVQPQLDKLFAPGSTAVLFPFASYSADGVRRLYNRPVITTEFNPALGTLGDILFADMDSYLLWEKGGVEAAVSIHVYFLSDETAFRFVARVDGKPAYDSALTPYIGSTTTSPFVALAATT